MKALILAPFEAASLQRLRQRVDVAYESWMETRRLYDPAELAERIRREDVGFVVTEADFLFGEVFEGESPLRFIGVCRGALNHVDLDAATQRGVLVAHTPGRNAVAVAELTVGLVFCLARRLPAADAWVKARRWQDPVEPYFAFRGEEVTGKTAGLLGLGATGAEVSRRLRVLGMRVLAHDPFVSPGKAARAGARLVGLDTLLAESDFLSVHAALTSQTERLLSGERLARMKPTAYLVNTAASGIVDEAALVQALRERRIAGAALDVHAASPLPPTSPFLDMDNVVLTPHIGGATPETVARHSRMIVEDIERFLDGQRPVRLANPEAWKGNARGKVRPRP